MKDDYLKPAIDFIEDCKDKDKVKILHHWDMDGVASAAIISKILRSERGGEADNVSMPLERAYHLSDEEKENLRDFDKLIILDFNLKADELEELNEFIDVLVVDHHDFDRKPGVSFVNPREFDEDVYIPCSKICLDIAAEFDIENKLRWIAGMGVIQDFGVDSCPELFEALEEDYEKYLPEELTQEELAKNCEYGRYASVLNIKPYRDSRHFSDLAYQALMKSDDLMELEALEEYRKVYEVYLEMQDEFTEMVENYEEEREIDREKMVIFFEIDSDFNITSSISTNMSTKTPEWIHLVIQKDDEVNISARCQSGRVDLGNLMEASLPEKAVEEGAEAGGHRKAAGASMPVQYYQEFKQNFLDKV
ncbi:MAG: DHH family phosphoesterase [Candidatus Nanohaloarchaea archaeon]